ncbi:MAG: glycerol-3-phosphate dehydrogenase/oxidase [Deltaproteobacteria bacterium]|nr:glycerol-3-phosphate dehydrogenase/oxidase [Deltaproteobacteria bacterium]
MHKEFSFHTRLENIQKLKTKEFDLLVIGGGITGAGIARDAALRGLRVALVEKKDFASGTSSKSSKLIHGGLRYLETTNFKLVFEALSERHIFEKTAPRLSHPLPFLIPLYKDSRVGMFKMACGLWLYDMLSLFRAYKNHKRFSKKNILQCEPSLKEQDLKGGFLYYDCLTYDSRLTINVVQSAHKTGAVLANYIEIIGADSTNNIVGTLLAKDVLTGKTFHVRAKNYVNATGPWSDMTRKIIKKENNNILRLTKGIHVIFPQHLLPTQHAFLLFAKDGRVFFLVPWGEFQVLGTTDTDFKESPDHVFATKKDVDYLLHSLRKYFPHNPIEHKDIISTFAGLRPLLKQEQEKESNVSREHEIKKELSNFYTIAGGKLTTYRKMAEEVVDLFSKEKCKTAEVVIEGQSPFPKSDYTEEEINIFLKEALHHEMTLTLCDFMQRRTPFFLTSKDQGLEIAEKVLPLMAAQLGWSETRKEQELQTYLKEIALSQKFKT